jgi:PadR family transcriptional regulator, regulatory protein PadR
MPGTLGDLEQVVLFALVRQGGESHGAPLVREIEAHTARRVSPGALYTVLDRLQTKGYVESWIGDSIPDRGGRRRKVYRIRPEGAAALREWYDGIQDMASGMHGRLDRLAEG